MADEEAVTENEDVFDTAFEEFANERTSDKAEPLDDPGGTDTRERESADSQDGAGGAAAGRDDPGAAADTDEARDGKGSPAGEEDPYAGWPAEAVEQIKREKAAREQLEHRVNSDAGRVRAFQTKYENSQKELDELRSKGASEGKPQPSNQEIKDAMAGSDEDWNEFAEDYPEIAGAIDRRFEQERQNIDRRLDTSLAPVVEKAEKESLEEAYGEVAKTYPTWQDAVKTDDFKDWMNRQPVAVRSLAESDDPADASSLIGYYDEHLVASGKDSLKANPENPTPPPGGVKNEASELEKRRAQQLEDGTTVRNRPARVDPSTESGDEFESAFNVYAARKDARNRANRA